MDAWYRGYFYAFCSIIATIMMVAGISCLSKAYGHEAHEGMSAEEKRVATFLLNWFRPKGIFKGIDHRKQPCCFVAGPLQDCFPVQKMRTVNGVLEVYPATQNVGGQYDRWFTVDTQVDEDLQPDPRESPDGRSYVCIVGGQVACFVKGAGL